MTERWENIDKAERWFQDGLRLMQAAEFFVMEDVEMQASQQIINTLRQQGIKCTYTHVVVRAAALALSRHPELNRLRLGNRYVYLDSVDIGLSVSSELDLTVPLTFVLPGVDRKSLPQLCAEFLKRVPEVRARDLERAKLLRKLARFFRFSWMRRALLRRMFSRLSTIKERNGTFHITCQPYLSRGAPFKSPTRAALTFAKVEERVVVRQGQPAVRLMATLSFSAHNDTWNGGTAAIFLNEIKAILEEGQLAEEANQFLADMAAR
ncbi:MAG TPA: 2-oxo acid dehydrogenase subunit E2 [Ktedonobacteraceae bacterium]|jgi:pyruvate dehydrogenase E2 component (dihydrolipoamide acetyltransferase)